MDFVSQNIEGVIICIKEINKNKRYDCPECYHETICDKIASASLEPSLGVCICTEIILNARNTKDTDWYIKSRDWQLLDSEGYAYHADNLCEILRGYRHSRILEPDFNAFVSEKTQVDFALTFPQIEDSKEIVAVKYATSEKSVVFITSDDYDELQKSFEDQSDSSEYIAVLDIENSKDGEYGYINRLIDALDLHIFSRVNNVLTPSEVVKLENAIRDQIFQINSEIKYIPNNASHLYEEKLSQIEQEYKQKLLEMNETEVSKRRMLETVDDLRDLSPREFEEYVADLLHVLGHLRITLTPSTGDEGIDVLSEYNGKKIAVQCKKHKGMIGSPDIQKFIGAMTHAEVDAGMFITTGIFSVHAGKIASKHPIEMIDKVALGELIEEAKSK